MAFNRSKEMSANLRSARHHGLIDRLRPLPDADRAAVLEFEKVMKDSLVEHVEEKIEVLWAQLPYKIFACFAFEDGAAPAEDACRHIGREVASEYDALCAAGLFAKIPRTAHRILMRGTLCRCQYEEWSNGDISMRRLPILFIMLKAYTRIPVMCRRTVSRPGKGPKPSPAFAGPHPFRKD